MESDWSSSEIEACVRTYLWMRTAESKGYRPVKSRVRDALISGPLSKRSDGSLEYRFQNISAVLDGLGEPWISGYKPAKNVGAESTKRIADCIAAYAAHKHARRLNPLVAALPKEILRQSVSDLVSGKRFDFPDSTGYDLVHDGFALPPKKVIGYAGLLHYGAPLFPDNFSGGEKTICFKRLEATGFEIGEKIGAAVVTIEEPEFRRNVKDQKSKGLPAKPGGVAKPKKVSVSSIQFVRDPAVVAFVELRANGICELCGVPAPFLRLDGTPFLEVHHVDSLSTGGPDTTDNAAALCPNCHRACHYSEDASAHRELLKKGLDQQS